ncbi:MAG: hypothetical protein AB8C95_10960 [Phycisphaeraceae bacterium]
MSLFNSPLLASWLDGLFGLDGSMSLGEDNTALGWATPLPGWAWLLIVLAALAIAHGSYARMEGARWARFGLATFRAMLLVALAVLLAGPTVVRTDVTPEADWLLVMVDRSASMTFEDTQVDGQAISRDDALRKALVSQLDLFGEEQLGETRNVVWFGYDREAYPIDSPSVESLLSEPSVQATNLRTALDQVLQSAAGRTISGVVLFGDGQSPQPTGEATIDKLARQDIPVFSVPLGSALPRLDLAVQRVDAPVSAFAGDLVPVTVTVRRQDILPGEDASLAIDPAKVVVRLIDIDTDDVVDERTLAEDGFDTPLRLQAQYALAGQMNLRAEVSYEGALTDIQTEIATSNNSRAVSIAMVDRPLKVLYVDRVRWEYRFLVPMLKREASIDSSILLVDADRGFVQEGNTPLSRFPLTAEEIRPYDVIMIGDVHPRFFSDQQLALMREHVATRRAGLLWIGGDRHTPNLYAGTDLELLLPMTTPSAVGRLVPATGIDVPIQPTAVADELNLLRLSLKRGEEPGSPTAEWPNNLPPFRWAQDLGTLRPGARTLAHATGMVDVTTGEPAPMVVLYRFGGGEVIYVGTDETWRWRKVGGEVYFEQFWIQLMRKLGRTRLQQVDDRARFVVSPPAVDLGATQLVELIMDDPVLIRSAPQSVRVEVLARGVTDEDALTPVGEVELRPTGFQGDLDSGARAVYQANWRSDLPGRFVLRVNEPLLESLELEASAEVRDPAQELARAATDHDRLIQLAKGTGGAVIELNNLAQLEKLVPNRARELTSETRQPLTNTLLALLVLLGLVTLEWGLRRGLKLV